MPQLSAIDLLVSGKNDKETAELLGLSRTCITKWRLFKTWGVEGSRVLRRMRDGIGVRRLGALGVRRLGALGVAAAHEVHGHETDNQQHRNQLLHGSVLSGEDVNARSSCFRRPTGNGPLS
jgi:hypothetical protein